MFRSLRPHTVVAAYLAARRTNPGTTLYPPHPFRPVENLRRRAAYARMQRTGATVYNLASQDSWAQPSNSKDPLGAAAAALGMYPFTPLHRSALTGPRMPELDKEPAFTVHVTGGFECVRSFAVRIDNARVPKPSVTAQRWARFLQIARQDPTVREVRAVHVKREPRDGKAPQ